MEEEVGTGLPLGVAEEVAREADLKTRPTTLLSLTA
jgi:hypothetical protein